MRRLLLLLLFAFACEGTPAEQPTHGELNINQATVEQLEKLPGIGPKHARSIVASRNARGGMFTTIDEIAEIDGIGPITVDKIRPYVILGPPKPKK
jgi:competence protein ComEA